MAPARLSSSASRTATFHLLGQSYQRSLSRLARRVGRRFAQRLGQLFVAVAHLDSRDDGFALFRPQSCERLLITLDALTAYGLFERRLSGVDLNVVEIRLI